MWAIVATCWPRCRISRFTRSLRRRLIDFGLRDYGTAEWEGGDAACDHVDPLGPVNAPSEKSTLTTNNGKGPQPGDKYHHDRTAQYRDVCGKCGARRIDRQIGLEPTPRAYVAEMVAVFREVRRVLRDDGVCWLNLGDSYAAQPAGNKTPSGFSQTRPSRISGNGDQETVALPSRVFGVKPKDLIGIPWRVAFALQEDGWWLRSDCIWSKPNPMPESVRDRPTRAHEYLFLLTKSARYWYDAEAIREPHQDENVRNGVYLNPKAVNRAEWLPRQKDGIARESFRMTDRAYNPAGRNKRSVWTVATQPFPDAHFATFPPKLIEPCILAGCPAGGVVLDPFAGAGTTLMVAQRFGRRSVGIELNGEYADMAIKRLGQEALPLVV